MFYVYGHFDEKDVCRYVGCEKKGRPYEFRTLSRSKGWHKAFPLGEPNKVVIFATTENHEESMSLEHEYIKKYRMLDNCLVNVLDGHHKFKGSFSEEARKIFPDNKKENPTRFWLGKTRDPELIQKMKIASHTPEAIAKRTESRKGWTPSAEHRKTVSEKLSGRVLSEEQRKIMSEAKKGKPNGTKGRKFTEEHKNKISQSRLNSQAVKESGDKIWETRRLNGTVNGYTTSRAKSVRCVTTGNIYRTAKEAAEATKSSDKHIQACCTGRRKKHNNMIWEYV